MAAPRGFGIVVVPNDKRSFCAFVIIQLEPVLHDNSEFMSVFVGCGQQSKMARDERGNEDICNRQVFKPLADA